MHAIIRLRKAGLTRQQIAAAVGCTRHAVRWWEIGERSPNADSRKKLIELADKFGIVLLATDFNADEREAA